APLFTEPAPGKKPLEGAATVKVAGTYSAASGRIELKDLAATGPGLSLAGRAQVQPAAEATFDVNATLAMAEAAPVLQCISADLAGWGSGILRAKGRLALAEGARPEESQVSLDLKVDRLQTEMLDLRNLVVEGGIEGGVARMKKATAQLNGGTARLDA